jgi:5'-nucleotidase
MRNLKRLFLSFSLAAVAVAPAAFADKLVILHTNDTHSQIDPIENEDLGGISRRKVVIDSVRAVQPNVLLLDAGDAVQGTLFFTLYKGELENKLMDALRYDVRILGNHEFDNASEGLAPKIRNTHSVWLTTNYDLKGGPLDGIFKPYTIREFGGKRIGIMAINLDPKGMVAEGNYNGVKYLDMTKAANATAWHLKHNEGCDIVVALTHIGYAASGTGTSDQELAAQTEDIDIIIGGHSHTTINPADPSSKPYLLTNAAGRKIIVAQTGKSGRNIGEITVDLDNLTSTYRLISINKRLDSRITPELETIIKPYRAGVDSLMSVPLTRSAVDLPSHEAGLLNFMSDFVQERAAQLVADGKVDVAIFNRGSLRRGLPKGNITEGMIRMMQPFTNVIEVLELKGSDLAENFDIMARGGGNGVSESADITFDKSTGKCTSILINGKPLDRDKTYRVATIDYLANGGDYMQPLTRGTKIAQTTETIGEELLSWLRKYYKKKKINPSQKVRMHAK